MSPRKRKNRKSVKESRVTKAKHRKEKAQGTGKEAGADDHPGSRTGSGTE